MKEFICLFKDHNYHRKAFDRQLNITVTFLESKNILYAPFCNITYCSVCMFEKDPVGRTVGPAIYLCMDSHEYRS